MYLPSCFPSSLLRCCLLAIPITQSALKQCAYFNVLLRGVPFIFGLIIEKQKAFNSLDCEMGVKKSFKIEQTVIKASYRRIWSTVWYHCVVRFSFLCLHVQSSCGFLCL